MSYFSRCVGGIDVTRTFGLGVYIYVLPSHSGQLRILNLVLRYFSFNTKYSITLACYYYSISNRFVRCISYLNVMADAAVSEVTLINKKQHNPTHAGDAYVAVLLIDNIVFNVRHYA